MRVLKVASGSLSPTAIAMVRVLRVVAAVRGRIRECRRRNRHPRRSMPHPTARRPCWPGGRCVCSSSWTSPTTTAPPRRHAAGGDAGHARPALQPQRHLSLRPLGRGCDGSGGQSVRRRSLLPGGDRAARHRAETSCDDTPVHVGGPVQPSRGFVLHSPTMCRTGPGDRRAVRAYRHGRHPAGDRRGQRPRTRVLALGYAGWAPGSSTRIQGNGWFVAPADPEIVFGRDNEGKWQRCLAQDRRRPVALVEHRRPRLISSAGHYHMPRPSRAGRRYRATGPSLLPSTRVCVARERSTCAPRPDTVLLGPAGSAPPAFRETIRSSGRRYDGALLPRHSRASNPGPADKAGLRARTADRPDARRARHSARDSMRCGCHGPSR